MRVCVICGKEIPSGRHRNCVTCSDECAAEKVRRYQHDYYEQRIGHGAATRKKEKPISDLSAAARAAKASGMSYGMYQARRDYEGKGTN